MLLFSSESLEKIRNMIKNKNAYIIPGIISQTDYFLSGVLQCPILVDEFELTKVLFSKSGSKRVFELNNIPSPIGAWDIQTKSEFYDTLVDLIKRYLNVNIWIFKMDSEITGRGIGYIQLDKIKSFLELKKERINNSVSEETFMYDLRNILIKVLDKTFCFI